jgi:putative transposase
MSTTRERSLIPHEWLDLSKWPRLDEASIHPEEDRARYTKRKLAVEMYAAGNSVQEIYKETRIGERETRRLVHRCVQLQDAETIWGFKALRPGIRIKPYTRKTAVFYVEGDGSSGCAGALGYLFDFYEGLQDLVDDLIEEARTRNGIPQSRLNFVEIAKEFRKELLRLGVPITAWPFNTTDKGVEALRRYSKTLLEEDADAYIEGRHGKEAAQRGAVGKGRRPILPNVRPYTYVQMDFQKIDAASIIVLTHPIDGTEVEIPVTRWWIGVVAEQKLKVVLGLYMILEVNPSAEAAIATVSSAILGPIQSRSDDTEDEDGNGATRVFLPLQLMPDLRGMSFAAIKVDNAWCNDANPTVDQLVDYLGAAVNFGRVRGWWRRAIVSAFSWS